MRRTALLAAAAAAMFTFSGSHAGAYETGVGRKDSHYGWVIEIIIKSGDVLSSVCDGIFASSLTVRGGIMRDDCEGVFKKYNPWKENINKINPGEVFLFPVGPLDKIQPSSSVDVVETLRSRLAQLERALVQEQREHQELVERYLPLKARVKRAEAKNLSLQSTLLKERTVTFSQRLIEDWGQNVVLITLAIALMMNARVRMRKFLANSRELRFQSMVEDLSQQIEDLKKEKATLSSPESFRTLQKRIDWLDGKWVGAEIVARVVDDNYSHTNSEGQVIPDILCYLPRWRRWGEAAFCTGQDLDLVIAANLKREQEERMFSDASGNDDNVVPLRRVGVATE